MSTLVCFHAHPDDESISTGGLMIKASEAGHRVILVLGTRGEQGEPVEGVLRDGEALWERRIVETAASAKILGAEEPRFLGYEDSGMIGTPENDNSNCFWQADVEEAAQRLADILVEVDADVLTIYDDHGNYGHPDHIQVYRVGRRAAEIAGITHVFEATANRTRIQESMGAAADTDAPDGMEDGPDPEMMKTFGTPASDIRFEVDVSAVIDRKKQSMMAHASQIGPDSFFLKMPDEVFVGAFGIESFNALDTKDTGGPELVDLLPGLS